MAQKNTPFNNLHDFIVELKAQGELLEIHQEVDSYLEITEIADRAVKDGREALLFYNVKDKDFPVVINLFAAKKRMELALQVNSLDEIGKRIRDMAELKPPKSLSDKFDLLPKLMEISNFMPKTVKKAPVQETVLTGDQIDLTRIPVLTCWPQDAGPFVTLPMVITRSPKTEIHNIGMYRLQVFDKNTTGMHWHMHKGGAKHYREYKEAGIQKMPVAVAIGGDPASVYSASAPLPPQINEFMFAGFLRKDNVRLVKALHSDLLVPAEAEFILEGYVDTQEDLKLEGMFGDHTGFYSLADYYPSFHVTAITHRKNAVYPATIVGRPPMEDAWLGYATERIFVVMAQMLLPEITDFHMPAEATFHNLIFVSIKKEYPGQAYKVMQSLWGLGLMGLTKMIVVVDDCVDVQNSYEAWWYALANIDPKHDTLFTKGPTDVLDHAARKFGFHSKLGIDGTRKLKEEGFDREWPDIIEMSPEIKKQVDENWQELMKDSKKGGGFR